MKEQLIVCGEHGDTETLIWAEQLSKDRFKLLENDVFDNRLNLGAIVETRLYKDSEREFVRVIEDSDYITKRFALTIQFKESEYRLLGDEIVKLGGHWEISMWGIAVVNLPKNSELYFDEISKTFNLDQIEIKN